MSRVTHSSAAAAPSILKKKALLQGLVVVAVLWVTALVAEPYLGWWPAWVLGALTLVAVVAGIYLWRQSKRSQGLMRAIERAMNPGERETVLQEFADKKLASGKTDILDEVARAQITAQKDPVGALKILEAIEINKAPVLMQDDIRANLALLYLSTNRTAQARAVAENIKLGRQGQPQSKAMIAAVVAEAFARTGSAQEADKVISVFNEDDTSLAQAQLLVLRAKLFVDLGRANRKQALARLDKIAKLQPQMVLSFMQKGNRPELQQMARQLAQKRKLLPQIGHSTRQLRAR